MGESLSQFGLTLKRAIEPNAEEGYSRQYISRLEHGKDVITPQLSYAFWHLATVLDDVPAAIGGAIRVTVLAMPGQVPDETLIPRNAKVATCARPGCNIPFIKVHPFQAYHDKECQQEWANERKRLARANR